MSSTFFDGADAENDEQQSGPKPTAKRAFDEMLETRASRRNVLRGIGATGTAAVAGSGAIGATGTASAQMSAGMLDAMSPDLAPYTLGLDITQSLTENLFSSPEELPADEIELHGEASYQSRSIELYYNRVDDDLERTIDSATLDAREAIASAYENGEDSTTAYSDAMTAIRDYYSRHEENHLKVLQFELTQISTLCEKVAQNDEIRSSFLHATAEPVEAGTGTDYDTMLIRDAANEETFTLENDEEITIQMPEIQARVHETDSTKDPTIGTTDRYPIDQALIDSWDGTVPEGYLVWADSDGIEYDSVMDFVMFSIEDPNEAGVDLRDSLVLFSMRQWMDRYHQIKDQSDSATGRFDQQIVDNMYDMMDAGNLDPAEVRGAEALAQFYAGEDTQVGDDAYNLALYNQLDLGQPDLTEMAHMTVTYSGATEQEAIYDSNGERQLLPAGYVEDQTMGGILYADQTPDAGLEVGRSYRIGEQVFAVMAGDVVALDIVNNEIEWEYTGDEVADLVDVSPDGDTLYSNWDNGDIRALDLDDPSEPSWVYSGHDSSVSDFDLSNDGSVIYSCSSEVHAVDVNNPSEPQWAYTQLTDPVSCVLADGVVVAGDSSGDIHGIDPDDGTQMWAYSNADPISCLSESPDGGTIYAGDGTGDVFAIGVENPSDGEIWRYSGHSGSVQDLVATDSMVFSSSFDSEVHAIDQGSSVWNYTALTNDAYGMTLSIQGDDLYVASDEDGIHSIPISNPGDAEQIYSTVSIMTDVVVPKFEIDMAGTLSQSMFYDASRSEEIQLLDGTLTIESMVNSDGEDIEEPQQWDGDPDYSTIDNSEFVEYVEQQNELIQAIENGGEEPESGGIDIDWPENPFGDGDGGGGGGMLGIVLVGLVVVSVAWSVVTDMIPFLGN